MTTSAARLPAFNHVAMSVPADLLGERGRAEILRFYERVFGWSEMPTLTEDRARLVLRAWSNEQFVFLVADERPMTSADGDHFGLSVATVGELTGMLERAQAYREEDPRVEIIDHRVEDYTVLKLHNFYVRFLLPLMIEVQCYEWVDGVGPQSLPAE